MFRTKQAFRLQNRTKNQQRPNLENTQQILVKQPLMYNEEFIVNEKLEVEIRQI